MELVYLWVEDYKNIHRQGFNFSPQFNCKFHDEYDDNGKLKDNCKFEIKKNDNNIENFFGDNINVTAIVGKNGSGKSSVSEMILSKVPDKKHKKYIIISWTKSDNKFHSWGNIKKIDLSGIKRISTLDIELASSGVEIGANNNRDYNHNLVYLNGSNFDFRTFEKYKYGDNDDNIFIPKYINQYNKNLKVFKNKTFFYEFDTVRCILKDLSFEEIMSDISHVHKEINAESSNKIKEICTWDLSEDRFCELLKKALVRFYMIKNNKYDYSHLELISNISDCSCITKESFDFIPKIDDIIDGILSLQSNILKTDLDIQTNTRHYFEFNIKDSNLFKMWIFQSFFDISNFIGMKKNNLPIFNLELYNRKKDLTYNLLSNGEKQYIRLLIEVISNRSGGDLNALIEPTLYIFDEIEMSLHPEWQKRIFNDIYYIFKLWKKQVHLIFLTHSPFLLSDIPKQNIIFLDTYNKEDTEVKEEKQKVGNCRVIPHDEVMNKKQTFGANIHTLLSDSFFMDDGLMGEFAKGKINEIIEFHKIVAKEKHKECLTKIYKKRKENLWNTQKIIGEEYLKQVIKNHLVEIEKILLGKDMAKKEEIARTKEYLKSLEDAQS